MNQSTYNISSIEWYAQMASVIQVPITLAGFVSNILLIIAHIKDPLKTFKGSSSLFIINIAFIDVILSFVFLISSLLTIVSTEYRLILKEGITVKVVKTFMEMSYRSFLCLSIERFLFHRLSSMASSKTHDKSMSLLYLYNMAVPSHLGNIASNTS